MTAGLAAYGAEATFAFETDDAYITLRYSEHLASGHGLRWNSGGAPVEGYSNFLYVVVGATALKLGLPPMGTFKVLGWVAIASTALILYRLSRLRVEPTWAMTAPLLYVAHPFVAWWGSSGMETPTYGLWVAGSIAAYLRGLGYRTLSAPKPKDGVEEGRSVAHLRLAGLIVCFASMTRPEGPIIMAAIVATTAIRIARQVGRGISCSELRRELESLRHVVVAFAYPFCVYTAWRLGHFGRLLPNSVSCKAGYNGDPWTLLRDFAPPATALLALAAPARRRLLATPHLTIILVALCYAGVLYGIAPVVAYGNRHFLAAYALLCVPAAAGLSSLAGRVRARRLWIPLGMVIVVLGIWTRFSIGARLRERAGRYDDRMSARAQVARWLNHHLEPGERYVLGDVGLVGYRTTSLDVIDLYCLNNPSMTEPPVQGSAEILAQTIMEQPPAAIVVSSRDPIHCIPRSNKYNALLHHPRFAEFALAARFGAPGDDFQYFVYARLSTIPR